MSLFTIFPTFAEAPYSYVVVSIIFVSSIIGFYSKRYFHALLLHPYEVYRGKRLHTLLTSAFVHRNWIHLMNNLLIVYGLGYDMFGNIDQEYGANFAYIWTLILWLALIVLPNFIQTIVKKDDFLFTAVGASGLSFGLYGFSALFFPMQKMYSSVFLFIDNALKSWGFALVVLLLLSKIPNQKLINTKLHVSSYLLGSLLALLVRPKSIMEIIDFVNILRL